MHFNYIKTHQYEKPMQYLEKNTIKFFLSKKTKLLTSEGSSSHKARPRAPKFSGHLVTTSASLHAKFHPDTTPASVSDARHSYKWELKFEN